MKKTKNREILDELEKMIEENDKFLIRELCT